MLGDREGAPPPPPPRGPGSEVEVGSALHGPPRLPTPPPSATAVGAAGATGAEASPGISKLSIGGPPPPPPRGPSLEPADDTPFARQETPTGMNQAMPKASPEEGGEGPNPEFPAPPPPPRQVMGTRDGDHQQHPQPGGSAPGHGAAPPPPPPRNKSPSGDEASLEIGAPPPPPPRKEREVEVGSGETGDFDQGPRSAEPPNQSRQQPPSMPAAFPGRSNSLAPKSNSLAPNNTSVTPNENASAPSGNSLGPSVTNSVTPNGNNLAPKSSNSLAPHSTTPRRGSDSGPRGLNAPPFGPRPSMMGRGGGGPGPGNFPPRSGRGGVFPRPPGGMPMPPLMGPRGPPPFMGAVGGRGSPTRPGMPPQPPSSMRQQQGSPHGVPGPTATAGNRPWFPNSLPGGAPPRPPLSTAQPQLARPSPPPPPPTLPNALGTASAPRPPGAPPRPPPLPPTPPSLGLAGAPGAPPPPMPPIGGPPGAPPLPPGAPPLPPGPPPAAPAFADDGNFLAKMLKEQEEEERKRKLRVAEEDKKKAQEEAKLEKERQAHAKRVAAENKRTKRFALGGGFGGGRSRVTRPRMGNSRGMVVKAFAADSDDEEDSEENESSKESSANKDDSAASTAAAATAAAVAAAFAGAGSAAGGSSSASGDGAAGAGAGQVGLGAAVALSQAAAGGAEVSEESKIMIRQTAEWFHANPDKSKVIIEKSRGNPSFSFLFDMSSPDGRFYRQVLEEIKTEEEVKRVCSGFGEANASGYGPTPTDSGNVYGPGAGLAAAAAAGGGSAGGSSWAGSNAPARPAAAEGAGAATGGNATQIAANISAQVAMRSASKFGAAPTPAAAAARSRKNRWDAATAKPTTTPAVTVSATGANALADASTAAAKLVAEAAAASGVAVPPGEGTLGKRSRGFSEGESGASLAAGGSSLALPETMDQDQEEQLRQQKEMQKLEARIREAATRQAMPGATAVKKEGEAERRMRELYEERLQEYGDLAAVDEEKAEDERDTVEDAEATGGVIDGGTWEHRKRAKEMLKTAEGALSLTIQGKGAHHMGQYLPKDELDKFLKKSDKAAKGEAAEVEEDFEKHKLDEGNIGFQMLKKAGWTEGQGLGKAGEGTAAPVNMSVGADGAGVGVKETHEVAEGDNEFEQYRKRMMLAYRFRPNPLNNPRRSYY